MSKEKIGRIAASDWMGQRASEAFAVYNANYNEDMTRCEWRKGPHWVAAGPNGYANFTTHAEALAWAFEKAEAGK